MLYVLITLVSLNNYFLIELAFLDKILFKDTKDIFFFIKTSFVKKCSCWNSGKDKSKIQEAKEIKTLQCQCG